MSDKPEKKRSLGEKLRDRYRIVVMDDDTLGELKSTQFSLMSLFIGLLATILGFFIITYLFISYTPIKYLIPGYADINNNRVYMELSGQIETLEEELDAQIIYTNGLKNILNPTGIKLDEIDENQDIIKNNTQIASKNQKLSNPISLDHYYFCNPLEGEVSAAFNLDKKHFGIDIVAPENSAVKSILDGVVVFSDWSVKNGNTISIQHRNNLISVYKHNSKLLKKVGQFVKKGEAICIIGNTGELTSGPHVHFEIWNNGIAIDPAKYINFK